MPISFNPFFSISVYLLNIFISPYQSKFLPFSFNLLFFILVYHLSIHFYLLVLVNSNSPLSLLILSSTSHSISRLSPSIPFYPRLSFSIHLSIQILVNSIFFISFYPFAIYLYTFLSSCKYNSTPIFCNLLFFSTVYPLINGHFLYSIPMKSLP